MFLTNATVFLAAYSRKRRSTDAGTGSSGEVAANGSSFADLPSLPEGFWTEKPTTSTFPMSPWRHGTWVPCPDPRGSVHLPQESLDRTLSDLDLEKDDLQRRADKLNKWNSDRRKLLALGQEEKRQIYHQVVKPDKTWMTTMEKKGLKSSKKLPAHLDPKSPQFAYGRRKHERPPTPMDMVGGSMSMVGSTSGHRPRWIWYGGYPRTAFYFSRMRTKTISRVKMINVVVDNLLGKQQFSGKIFRISSSGGGYGVREDRGEAEQGAI